MKKSRDLKYVILILFLSWTLTHVFSINWDLPSCYEHAQDCILATPNLTAQEMMTKNTCKYPPLQYLLVGTLVKPQSTESLSPQEIQQASSARIIIFRTVCAVMALGILLLLLAIGVIILQLPAWVALLPCLLYELLPVTLYYSHTSNMDIPYTFWFMLSVFAALYAVKIESCHQWRGYLCHVLCGIAIACAFCTKDQVYALYILPAFFLVWYRWQQSLKIWQSFLPLLIWGGTFLAVVALIYLAAGGYPIAQAHFQWIFNNGKNDFFMTGNSLPERLTILWLQLKELSIALDWPMLFMTVVLLIVAIQKGELKQFWRQNKLFLLALFLLFLSMQLFLLQVLRANYTRFMIPVIPFFLLTAVMLWYDLYRKKQIPRGFIILCIVLQSGVAIQFICNLTATPGRKLRDFCFENKLPENYKIASTMATMDYIYPVINHKIRPIQAIRPWSAATLDFTPYQLPDLVNIPFSYWFCEPAFLIVDAAIIDSAPFSYLFENKFYQIVGTFFQTQYLFTLFPLPSQEFYLLQKQKFVFPPPDDSFNSFTLNQQLMHISHIFSQDTQISQYKMKLLGERLQPFTAPDFQNFGLSKQSIQIISDAYRAAGRTDHAEKSTRFFQKLP